MQFKGRELPLDIDGGGGVESSHGGAPPTEAEQEEGPKPTKRFEDFPAAQTILNVMIALSGARPYSSTCSAMFDRIVSWCGFLLPVTTMGIFMTLLRVGESMWEEVALGCCVGIWFAMLPVVSHVLNRRYARGRARAYATMRVPRLCANCALR